MSDIERIVGIHNGVVVIVVVDGGREAVIVGAGDGDGEEAIGGGVGTTRDGVVHGCQLRIQKVTAMIFQGWQTGPPEEALIWREGPLIRSLTSPSVPKRTQHCDK